MGQLPVERITPDIVFEHVGVDYAGPVCLKVGHVRKPTLVKAYICVFVSLSVKAVQLELVSDLTTDAFIACLRRFISRGVASLRLFGVITGPTLLERRESYGNWSNFSTNSEQRKLFVNSVPHMASIGTSFRNVLPILGASGRQR